MFFKYVIGLASLITVMSLGCGRSADVAPTGNAAAEAHNHGGWWCDEHGVPEEVCARCNIKLVADFKAKGDWCQDHDRPDSQCFVCHPDKQAEFAAQYQAKYGKQPPQLAAEQ